MIERGVLVANTTVAEVMRLVQPRTVLIIGVKGAPDAAAKLIEETKLTEKIEIRDGKIFVTLSEGTTDYSVLPTMLIERGQKLVLFKEDEINLETAFMALTKGITS